MNDRFEGIVLFTRPHRENDALVKIFTQEYGTKMFFVRGLQKPSHSNKAQLLPLTYNEYVGTINEQGLSFITEGKTIDSFRNIQTDIEKQAYGAYISQLVDASVDDNEGDLRLFDIFKASLRYLNQKEANEILATYMEIFLLEYFGNKLNFTQCAICGRSDLPMDFSVNHQGVLCKQHWHEDPYRLQISPRAMYVAGVLSQVNINQINQIDLSPETLKDLRRLMDEIYQEFVGLRLRSKSYLDQLLTYQNKLLDPYSKDEN